MESAMEITVNGVRMTVRGLNIQDLLIELGIDPTRIAVEHNLEIVPRRMQESVRLCDGDQIEIVHLVGGG
jgi:thiamine biosynthesis protein ThiS